MVMQRKPVFRERFDSATLPIIAMTAYAIPSERQRCFDVGMNGHIAKPIDFTLFEKALAQYLPMEAMSLIEQTPSLIENSTVNEDDLQEGIIKLAALLRRKSLEARAVFKVCQPLLASKDADRSDEIAAALARLDFKRAQETLGELAKIMGIHFD